MAEDSRQTGKVESGTATLAAGDAAVTTVSALRSEETLSVAWVKVEYSNDGTTAGTVDLYDEADGTASGDLNDKVDQFEVTPGDDREYHPVYRDFENGVVIEADGSHDDEVVVTVGGYLVTG